MYLQLVEHKHRQRELEKQAKRERLARQTWQPKTPTRKVLRVLSRVAALFL
jgi:hypothetical protein